MEFIGLVFTIQLLIFFGLIARTLYLLIKDYTSLELADSIITFFGVGISYLIGFVLIIQNPTLINFVSVFSIQNLFFWLYSFLFAIITIIQIKNIVVNKFNETYN